MLGTEDQPGGHGGCGCEPASYFSNSFSWQNAPGEADSILATASEFQAPNGGMAFYEPRDDYVSPFLSAFTAKAFNWLKETGHAPPAQVEEKLIQYLLNLLKRDESEDSASRSVVADVRAPALSALRIAAKSRAPIRTPLHAPAGDGSFRESHVPGSPGQVPDTLEMRKEVVRSIFAHSDQSSGTIRFSEQPDRRCSPSSLPSGTMPPS